MSLSYSIHLDIQRANPVQQNFPAFFEMTFTCRQMPIGITDTTREATGAGLKVGDDGDWIHKRGKAGVSTAINNPGLTGACFQSLLAALVTTWEISWEPGTNSL